MSESDWAISDLQGRTIEATGKALRWALTLHREAPRGSYVRAVAEQMIASLSLWQGQLEACYPRGPIGDPALQQQEVRSE